jgi:fimbrial isopeptide formation D2 family protein
MRINDKLARGAIAAGLTLAMGLGGLTLPATALAETTYGTGNITIGQVKGNDTTFTGYRIFKAKVTDDSSKPSGKSVSEVEWVSPDVKTAVERATGQSFATAQDAADWITANVSGTDDKTAAPSGSVADNIAKAVSGLTATTTVKPGEATSLDEGYWLFVTTAGTATDGEVATAPIFAVVGGGDVHVMEKGSVPTVRKTLADGKSTSGSTGVGKVVSYKLEGTVARDIASYASYAYQFNDQLSAGLDYKPNSAKVEVDGTDVTKSATISYDGTTRSLTIGFDDLKKVATLTKDSKVTVTYDATVNKDAIAGTGTNLDNTVSLTYSNDPHSTTTVTTKDNPTVKEYTYKLKLIKVDRDTEKALTGATFIIMSSDGKYVQGDGSLGTDAHTFTASGDDGFTVNGLDAGTYTVSETGAPTSEGNTAYDKASDFTFTISPTISEQDVLTGITNTVTGDDAIAGTSNGDTGDHKLVAKDGTSADVAKGTVTVTVGDKKQITMPLTGMKGTTALVVYGSVILVVSAGAYLKHRHDAADAE